MAYWLSLAVICETSPITRSPDIDFAWLRMPNGYLLREMPPMLRWDVDEHVQVLTTVGAVNLPRPHEGRSKPVLASIDANLIPEGGEKLTSLFLRHLVHVGRSERDKSIQG
jgi:hypothetical protein